MGAGLTLLGAVRSDWGAAFDGAVNPTASPELIARLLSENASQFEVGTNFLLVGQFLLIWFFLYLGEAFRGRGAGRWPAAVSVAGGLITVVLFALDVALARASIQTTFRGASAVVPKTFVALSWDLWRAFSPFISAHLVATGIVIVQSRVLPRIVGAAALALAVLPLVVPPGLVTAVFLLWTAALSLALLISGLRWPARP